jgi:tetrahydromethanopterin S-methyltransferase subunit G
LQDQAKRPNVEMNQEALKQLLEANSQKDFDKNKAVLDGLDKKIDKISADQTEKFAALGRDIKGIKDEVKTLTQRIDSTEKALNNIENTTITREELSEIQRKKAEIIIFDPPETTNDLKEAALAKLNEEEIKFIRKISKASNGKIQPTLAWWCSEVQQSVKSS